MLVVMDQPYLDEVKDFAKRTGQIQQLEEQLAYLNGYGSRWSTLKDGKTWADAEAWSLRGIDGDENDPWERGVDNGLCYVKLGRDFAPYSFSVVFERNLLAQRRRNKVPNWSEGPPSEVWMVGGLIYHGLHDRGGDGGAPTFSVNTSDSLGWSVHT